MRFIDPLEQRRLFSALPAAPQALLTEPEVESILARAASQARPGQAIVVADREGVVLGALALGGAPSAAFSDAAASAATARARTAAFFQSEGEAFTTRTARFIIQDHFPHPVRNTPGGPLYGVQFSTLPGSDVPLDPFDGFSISGDPGGVPLYKNGHPVGGIGVAGDGSDIAPRQDLLDLTALQVPGSNPQGAFFNGREERDFDEAVALAGASQNMAPPRIRATHIFIDGLRLPFTRGKAAKGNAGRSFTDLTAAATGNMVVVTPTDSVAPPFPITTIAGVEGQLKNTSSAGRALPVAATGQTVVPDDVDNVQFGFVDSNDADPDHLLATDVAGIISDAVSRAVQTRAGIRKPNGRYAVVHVTVVDRDGDLLGAFRMGDGTNFSFDVAVQKARTAAFVSDDTHAISTRAVGFVSQRYFPPGINHTAGGPLFGLQKELSTKLTDPENTTLRNGITIFPGGVPLYRNGKLVGAVGVSGDGVDQDDLISFAGSQDFQPPPGTRSDELSKEAATTFLLERVAKLDEIFEFTTIPSGAVEQTRQRLAEGFEDFRLPYVKFPRNPKVDE